MSEINFNDFRVYPDDGSGSIVRNQFNDAVDLIQRNTLQSGVGYFVKRTANGTTLEINNPPGAAESTCPFDMTVGVVSSNLYIKFVPATINGVLPDNIFTGITGSYTAGATQYVYADCTSDGQTITDCSLVLETSDPTSYVQTPTAWTAPSEFHYLIGVIVDKAPFKTIACSNLVMIPTFVGQEPADDITPNSIPYDNYFIWLPVAGVT